MALRTLPLPSLTFLAALSLTTSLVIGCGGSAKPPKETPPPDDSKKWEVPEVAKAPPKCEALKEKCEASAATKAKIAKSTFALTPIKGWNFAQTDAALIAQGAERTIQT